MQVLNITVSLHMLKIFLWCTNFCVFCAYYVLDPLNFILFQYIYCVNATLLLMALFLFKCLNLLSINQVLLVAVQTLVFFQKVSTKVQKKGRKENDYTAKGTANGLCWL